MSQSRIDLAHSSLCGFFIWETIDMPRGYEKMRDAFMKKGMSSKRAKTKAARIWNANHPNNPVTGNYESKKRKSNGKKKSMAKRRS